MKKKRRMEEVMELTIEDILESALEDPRITSAIYKDGVFHLETVAGLISFGFKKPKYDA